MVAVGVMVVATLILMKMTVLVKADMGLMIVDDSGCGDIDVNDDARRCEVDDGDDRIVDDDGYGGDSILIKFVNAKHRLRVV
jgi:hypothetical protein